MKLDFRRVTVCPHSHYKRHKRGRYPKMEVEVELFKGIMVGAGIVCVGYLVCWAIAAPAELRDSLSFRFNYLKGVGNVLVSSLVWLFVAIALAAIIVYVFV